MQNRRRACIPRVPSPRAARTANPAPQIRDKIEDSTSWAWWRGETGGHCLCSGGDSMMPSRSCRSLQTRYQTDAGNWNSGPINQYPVVVGLCPTSLYLPYLGKVFVPYLRHLTCPCPVRHMKVSDVRLMFFFPMVVISILYFVFLFILRVDRVPGQLLP